MGFRILFSVVLVLLQTLVYFSFIHFLKSTKFYKPVHRWYALIPFLLFNVPFFIIAFTIGRSFYPPEWFRVIGMIPFWIWHGATFLIAVYLLIGKIIKMPFKLTLLLLKLIKPIKHKIQLLKSKPAIQKVDVSRRKFLRTSAFAFSSYAFGASAYGIVKHNKYVIEYEKIKLNNLPDELKSFTITLISDIHAGQYMTEDDMKMYADVVNELNSDIICIPGDFINFQTEDTKIMARAFKDLEAKYGIYGTLGNHDFFVDAEYVAGVIKNESPIKLLRNENENISVNGKDLFILGVDDTRDSGVKMNQIVLEFIDNTISSAKTNNTNFSASPKILLCHKPYAFDDIALREVDLVLAGHTHGGQVVPFKFGDFNISFAALVSEYIEGLYTIGSTNMYVSRGIGTVALPIRLNCPPEITKITLV